MSEISSQVMQMQVSGLQIRAARALLGLSSEQLGALADVGWATVRRFEEGEVVPRSRSNTLQKVKQALEQAGIEFLGDPITSPGVRLRRNLANCDGGVD
jgi:DNA-binding transcriptional regulator YiaG